MASLGTWYDTLDVAFLFIKTCGSEQSAHLVYEGKFGLESANEEDSNRCHEFIKTTKISKQGRQAGYLSLLFLYSLTKIEKVPDIVIFGRQWHYSPSLINVEQRKLLRLCHDLKQAVLECYLMLDELISENF